MFERKQRTKSLGVVVETGGTFKMKEGGQDKKMLNSTLVC